MSQRHPYAVVAGIATILAAFPLTQIFKEYTWLVYAAFAVAVVVGAAMLVRTARGPVWTQVIAMAGALLLFLTAVFPSKHEFLRLIPTAETFKHFNALLGLAGDQIRPVDGPVDRRAEVGDRCGADGDAFGAEPVRQRDGGRQGRRAGRLRGESRHRGQEDEDTQDTSTLHAVARCGSVRRLRNRFGVDRNTA